MSLRDRYLNLIDNIVNISLEGKIRSKEQVYRMLTEEVSLSTGEIFELCLDERINVTESQLETKLKATRILRALQTIKGEWERYLKDQQISAVITSATQEIIDAESEERLITLLKIIDQNQAQILTLEQIQQLVKSLKQELEIQSDLSVVQELRQLTNGITRGIESWQKIEPYLISWIYEQNNNPLGFGGIAESKGPWILWSKQVDNPLVQQLFKTIASNQSLSELPLETYGKDVSSWVELAIIFQYLQRGLVAWFDQQPYNVKIGKQLSISTFLTFAGIWSQLAQCFNLTNYQILANSCFQIMLQILRTFAQRPDFPLYGGIFASFSGEYLKNTLAYLDTPLKKAEKTQEKARILTLLGYSERALGQYEKAISFHEDALKIARSAEDKLCEIANFNHLSRIFVAQKNYPEAINYSQRALILARQTGDKLGEANALVNLGYSEVFSAREKDSIEPEIYESAINYLEQGLALSIRLEDNQSKALCYSSLGIAYLILEQPQTTIKYLTEGWKSAQFSGDLYLQGLNLSYLGEAYYSISLLPETVIYAGLGMYLLEQIGANEWRQPAGLLTILKGKEAQLFEVALKQGRGQIIALIGVDGYDYLPELLAKYQQ